VAAAGGSKFSVLCSSPQQQPLGGGVTVGLGAHVIESYPIFMGWMARVDNTDSSAATDATVYVICATPA